MKSSLIKYVVVCMHGTFQVRLVDEAGIFETELPTLEAISKAASKKKDLYMIDFDGVAICQIASSVSELATKPSLPDESSGYSFDPTSRPATIQMSARIASEEFEMKMDILRKHLLQKKQCVIVLKNQTSVSLEDIGELVSSILKDVSDIAKLGSELDQDKNGDVVFKIWPCKPEQTMK